VSTGEFEKAVKRLTSQVGHWEAGRWAASAGAADSTRAEAVRALVQRLADRAAEAEDRSHRPVPHLADTVLPDQLRVMADDLLAADPAEKVLAEAAEEVTRVRKSL
jgi:hypothetical protein